jgi:hypothetical protein
MAKRKKNQPQATKPIRFVFSNFPGYSQKELMDYKYTIYGNVITQMKVRFFFVFFPLFSEAERDASGVVLHRSIDA